MIEKKMYLRGQGTPILSDSLVHISLLRMHAAQITEALQEIDKLVSIPLYEAVDAQAPLEMRKPCPPGTEPSPHTTTNLFKKFFSLPLYDTVDLFDEIR